MAIRILRVIARMNIGGPAIHATLLVQGLDPARYETTLVTGLPEAGEGNYLDLHQVTLPNVVVLPALGREVNLWRDAKVFAQMVRLIREYRPDIVHTHTAKAGFLGRLAAWRCGVPLVVHTFHGHVFKGYFSRSKEAVFVLVERLLARVTTRLVAVNTTVRDEVLERGVGRPEQFQVVSLGFNLTPFLQSGDRAGELRRELGLAAATPLVGIVARLAPIKAHDVFVAMADSVLRTFPEAIFAIVGDGERRRAIEADIRKRGIEKNFRFLGWRADLDRVYADLDIVVLTSRNEGSPVALIEAMAAARPVVATRAGGVAELVGEAGLLAPIDDVPALTDGVLRLLTDRSFAAELGRRSRERVVPRFDKSRLIADIDAMYGDLLVSRSPAGGHGAHA
jgi:glycosyltransferase involved in cell wall biosynthesis